MGAWAACGTNGPSAHPERGRPGCGQLEVGSVRPGQQPGMAANKFCNVAHAGLSRILTTGDAHLFATEFLFRPFALPIAVYLVSVRPTATDGTFRSDRMAYVVLQLAFFRSCDEVL